MDITGNMKVREKCRGSHVKTIKQYVENTFKKYEPDLKQLYIGHYCKDMDLVKLLINEVSKYHQFENIQVSDISCNCAIHNGKDTLGMSFLMKD